ncbi:hypothetical protein ACX0G9_01600 [Flavitalea flava]
MKPLSPFYFCFAYTGLPQILLAFIIPLGFLYPVSLTAQADKSRDNSTDSIKYDYRKIYSYCLDGDIKPSLLLVSVKDKKISQKDLDFKTKFESRFKYPADSSGYLESKRSAIDGLLKIYYDYWRKSLLDNSVNYDSAFKSQLCSFLKTNYLPAGNLTVNEDSIDLYLNHYLASLGLHTTGFGKTGRLIDLLVWRTEKDTTYTFKLYDEKTSSRVILMDDFITLGWEEYATLDRYYPGGWATKEALYCVAKGYDLNSEDFMISYLAHESRHFADYKLFPKLVSADLEYRAKLTELSMAHETLYKIIEFFIGNSNYASDNGHSVANYCAIRDLSKILFNVDFERDIQKWKNAGPDKINKAAYEVLKANTKALTSKGAEVEKLINLH